MLWSSLASNTASVEPSTLFVRESQISTRWRASTISVLVAQSNWSTFCRIEPGKKNGPWLRQLILWRTIDRVMSEMSFPSTIIWPETTSLRRRRESAKLLLPLVITSSQYFAPQLVHLLYHVYLPVLPQTPSFFPALIWSERLMITGLESSVMLYEMLELVLRVEIHKYQWRQFPDLLTLFFCGGKEMLLGPTSIKSRDSRLVCDL